MRLAGVRECRGELSRSRWRRPSVSGWVMEMDKEILARMPGWLHIIRKEVEEYESCSKEQEAEK